jgi:hypothetical protein
MVSQLQQVTESSSKRTIHVVQSCQKYNPINSLMKWTGGPSEAQF